tara:strand:- start:851 stop:1729 length:879 start_codon:yes stop_codon:yes gene_type:complete
MIRIVETPQKWMPKNTFHHPPHQGSNPLIEERALAYFSTVEVDSDYIYIPIQWTMYHCSNRFGKDVSKIKELQDWCNALTNQFPDEKFFTVVQYDDGTLVSIDRCKVFASSNSSKSPKSETTEYLPIPLLSQPHPGNIVEEKKYKVGFVGRNDTHKMRKEMIEKLQDNPEYKFVVNISGDLTSPMREVGFNSMFGLSPRGYGPASFRMYETMQMGGIPIYISDEFWLPFSDVIEWNKAVLLVKDTDIETIPDLVNNLIESGEYKNYQEYGKMVYDKYLTWDGTLNQIAKIIL